jgi:uncharacterized protein YbjT (DUF2867 family)
MKTGASNERTRQHRFETPEHCSSLPRATQSINACATHAKELIMDKILVLGATGKTGRRVVERLTANGVVPRRGSRSENPRFDWDERDTWAAALDGIERVYLSYYPDLSVPGATDSIGAFVDCAISAGVQRLVMLSGRGEPQSANCEQLVRESGAEYTIVRSSFFSQNFSESFFLGAVLAGELALPVGSVPEPFVDADDVADVAASALLEDRHVNQLYEVTGPRLWTFEEAIAEISRAAVRRIRYVQVSPDDYTAALVADGVPPDYVSLLSYLFTEVCDGRNASLGDGVQRALGRQPREFGDYVAATATTWSAA